MVAGSTVEPLWRWRIPEREGSSGSLLKATARLWERLAVIDVDDGRVFAFDASTGRPAWNIDVHSLGLESVLRSDLSVAGNHLVLNARSLEKSSVLVRIDRGGKIQFIARSNAMGAGCAEEGVAYYVTETSLSTYGLPDGKKVNSVDGAFGSIVHRVGSSGGVLAVARSIPKRESRPDFAFQFIDSRTGRMSEVLRCLPEARHPSEWRSQGAYLAIPCEEGAATFADIRGQRIVASVDQAGVASDIALSETHAYWAARPNPTSERKNLRSFDLAGGKLGKDVAVPFQEGISLAVSEGRVLVGGRGLACYRLDDMKLLGFFADRRVLIESVAGDAEFVAAFADPDRVMVYRRDELEGTVKAPTRKTVWIKTPPERVVEVEQESPGVPALLTVRCCRLLKRYQTSGLIASTQDPGALAEDMAAKATASMRLGTMSDRAAEDLYLLSLAGSRLAELPDAVEAIDALGSLDAFLEPLLRAAKEDAGDMPFESSVDLERGRAEVTIWRKDVASSFGFAQSSENADVSALLKGLNAILKDTGRQFHLLGRDSTFAGFLTSSEALVLKRRLRSRS